MSISSNTSSGKRKRSSPKFYAVRKGRKPGIYYSWDDCKVQVDGISAECADKSFPTLTEAEAFMKGTPGSTSNSSKSSKFYGVAVGHVPGVYADYSSVQAQIKNCPGAKHRSFASREEAQAFVNEHKRDASAPISLRGDLSETSSLVAGKGCKVGDNTPKKQKIAEEAAPSLANGEIKWEPGMGPLPEGAEDGFDPTLKLDPETGNIVYKTEEELNRTKRQPTGDFTGVINVYTDGSSLGNGQLGAIGGVGVYFGPNDSRNISEPLRGERQTNQRAELTAVARALDHIPIDRAVLIHTDSNYSIKCLTEWFPKWEKNNWKSSSGKAVENKDLIEPIIARIREREMCRAKTNFKWIKGHANDPGNIAADQLAVQGSRFSTPELRNARTTSATLNTPTRTREELEALMKQGKEKEEEDNYDKLFATLAAEQSAQGFDEDLLAQFEMPPAIAASKPANGGAKEGQDQLVEILNGDPQDAKLDESGHDNSGTAQKAEDV
ncbi:ribonuclease H-like domain-containing protein [Paraphoma chrysanthemicola]|uniref:ribonuclease H n=1 Tax=Paraphoma chrysanthemicola TaxID=798071 RepID=A0A8K0W0L5_9PLEO|nr:ribonuclease H-like domain-containing protein [Paraphoma chrysanthemicola]